MDLSGKKYTINYLNLLHSAFKSSNTTGSTGNLVSMLRSIGLQKSLFFVNIPHSDFRGLLICYRGHVSGPKSVKKHSFAISDRLTIKCLDYYVQVVMARELKRLS